MKTKEDILQKQLDVINKGNTSEIQFCYNAIFKAMEEYAQGNGVLPCVGNWVAVTDRLPIVAKYRMSEDVLTIAGGKMSVKCYNYGFSCWTGSQHITVEYWMELPKPPCC